MHANCCNTLPNGAHTGRRSTWSGCCFRCRRHGIFPFPYIMENQYSTRIGFCASFRSIFGSRFCTIHLCSSRRHRRTTKATISFFFIPKWENVNHSRKYLYGGLHRFGFNSIGYARARARSCLYALDRNTRANWTPQRKCIHASIFCSYTRNIILLNCGSLLLLFSIFWRMRACLWSVLAAGASSSASTHWRRLAMTKCVV